MLTSAGCWSDSGLLMETGEEHNNLERLTALGCQRLTWFSSVTMSSKLFGLNAIAETTFNYFFDNWRRTLNRPLL
jgi:hypothetical protein